MQNCPLSVVFGLGHFATATASSAVSICNDTHTIFAGARLYSARLPWWNPGEVARPRLCLIENGDAYGRPTRTVTAESNLVPGCEQPCATFESEVVTLRGNTLAVAGASPARTMRVRHTHTRLLAVSSTDVWLVGDRCVRSAATQREVCIADPTFTAKTVATTNHSVLVADARGDVYAVHHSNTTSPAVLALLGGRRRPSGTWHVLPPVLAASRLDASCMIRQLGALLRVSVAAGLLTRVFEHRIVVSALPPATSAGVWLPYLPADTAVCGPVPAEPCHWSERALHGACVARRPCAAVAVRPDSGTDFVCGVPRSDACGTACNTKKRRQLATPPASCVPAVEVCVPLPTCGSASTALALLPAVPTSGIEPGAAPACANISYQLGGECVPCSRCGAGTRMAEPCSGTADAVCLACPPGTYQPEPWHDSPRCFRANMCPGTTRYTNGVCAPESYNMHLLWAGLFPAWLVVVLRATPLQ